MGQMLLGKLSAATQDCDTDSFSAEIAGKMSMGLGGMLGGAKYDASITQDSNSGCQALQTVLGNYLNSIYQSRCLINNTSALVTVNITVDQNASISASGAGTIVYPPNPSTCSRPSITQKVTLQLKDITKMSDSTASNMANIVSQGLQNTTGQLLTQSTGFQATPQGMNQIQAIQSKVKQSLADSSIANAIQNASRAIIVSQNGSITASNGAIVYAPCTIDQNSILDLQLAEIISEAYAATVSSELSAFLTSAQTQSADIKNAGAPNAFSMLSNNWGIIIGAVVALILGVVVVKVIKSKTAQDALSKNGKLGGLTGGKLGGLTGGKLGGLTGGKLGGLSGGKLGGLSGGKLGGLSGGKLGGLSGGKLGGLTSILGDASNISSEVLPGAFRFRYY
jgi:hypothetical protein